MTRRMELGLQGAGMWLVPGLALAQESGGEVDYVIVFGGMIAGLIALAIIFNFVLRGRRARFETIRLLIEKGQEIPPQLLGPGVPAPRQEKWSLEELRGHAVGWGNVFTFLGVGIGLANYLSAGDWRSAAWGLIFVFLGIGWFVNAAIIHRSIKKQARDD